MASLVDLDTLVGFGKAADAALAKVVKAVMQANSWKVTGACKFQGGPTGYALHVDGYPGPISAVSTGTIAAASGSTLGSGPATLRYRSGATLTDGPSVTVYSHMTVSIASGTRLVVAPDADAYLLLTAMCP